MKKLLVFGFIVIFLPFLTGCIQVDTLIKVKPDGSGVIEETFLMNKTFVQQIKVMMEQMAQQMEQQMEQQTDKQVSEGMQEGKRKQAKEAQKKPESFDIFNEKELKERAGELGEDVTYVSGSKITTDEYEGYKAIYAFKDIQKIRINQNPGEKVPSGPQQGETGAQTQKEHITFIHTKGKPSVLLIKLPEQKPEEKPETVPEDQPASPTDDKQAEAAMEQMKGLFEGMKIAVTVEVEGNIIETNATYREGSKVTLMELDFGKLIQMPEAFKKFSLAQPETLEETKQFMKDIPGIKVEFNREINITFK
jgi:hypothetical protein